MHFRPYPSQTKPSSESPNAKGMPPPAGPGGLLISLTDFHGDSASTTPDTGSPLTPTSPPSEPDEDTISKLALDKCEPAVHTPGHHRSSSEPPFLKKLNGLQSGQLSEASGYGSMTTQSTSSCSDAGRRYTEANLFMWSTESRFCVFGFSVASSHY